MMKKTYPFSAIVGQEEMKRALLLNIVMPSLGGVLIKGEKGTAKSTAVRAAAELLVSAVCDRWMRAPGGIHLRFLGISIIFGANFFCVHNVRAIFVILHRKNEHLFGRGQFG